MRRVIRHLALALALLLPSALIAGDAKGPKPRLSLFIGVDISGSFLKGKHFDDSMSFLAHYLYSHLNALGGLEVPATLFVGSIGGATANEPKTFYPIQTFEHKSVEEIQAKLNELFPKTKENPFTDYNAFFRHISDTVQNRKLILRPVSVVLISDGQPDVPGRKVANGFAHIDVQPLENLSRNITVRLLYTNAVTGGGWQNKVKRRRVKIWTQDAEVMTTWKEPNILLPQVELPQQERFLGWIKDNVDFGVRAKRVD